MANVLRHRFVSAKTDGPDATQIQPSNWNDGHAFTGGAAGHVLTRDPTDATFGATWQPVGVWMPVPHNAADFRALSGSVWNVTPAALRTFEYCVIGRTIMIALFVYDSTLTGASSGLLEIKIPGGFVSTSRHAGVCGVGNNPTAAFEYTGYSFTAAGDPWFKILKPLGVEFDPAYTVAVEAFITIAI